MARFVMPTAYFDGQRRFHAGQILTTTRAEMQPGDTYFTSPLPPQAVLVGTPTPIATGVESIDG